MLLHVLCVSLASTDVHTSMCGMRCVVGTLSIAHHWLFVDVSCAYMHFVL